MGTLEDETHMSYNITFNEPPKEEKKEQFKMPFIMSNKEHTMGDKQMENKEEPEKKKSIVPSIITIILGVLIISGIFGLGIYNHIIDKDRMNDFCVKLNSTLVDYKQKEATTGVEGFTMIQCSNNMIFKTYLTQFCMNYDKWGFCTDVVEEYRFRRPT
jgi:hypothetical protein